MMPEITIRSFRPDDGPAVALLSSEVRPAGDARPIYRRIEEVLSVGGRAWVMEAGDRLVGFARIEPVPGLEGLYDLGGGITPEHQRQGLGGKLLTRLLGDLKGNEVRTVTHAVKSLDSPAALFLRKHHFFIEHQEWRLALEDLEELPPVELPAGFRIDTFPLPVAIRHFRRLYDAIFAGLPWYQPYVSDREVAAELVDPADLLFLLAGKKPVGFLWTRLSIKDTAEIEPVGITVPYRGRGLARMLVLAGLRQLADQGARRVALGAWSENQVAIRLYGSLGFQRVGLLTYLAIET